MAQIPMIQSIAGSMVGGARSGALRRVAASGGDTNNAESAILPAERQATMAGSKMLKDYINNTNSQFNNAQLQVEMGFAGAPQPASPFEYLSSLGGAVQNYAMFHEYNKTLKGLNTTTGIPAPAAPGSTAVSTPKVATPETPIAPSAPTGSAGTGAYPSFQRLRSSSPLFPRPQQPNPGYSFSFSR
jgi:hypothetical protein